MRLAKWVGILGIALILALGLWQLIGTTGDFLGPSISGPSVSDRTWEEDVTLASGETVRFKRRMRIEQNYSWGIQSMGPKVVRDATLGLVTPNGSFVPWSAPIMPFYIDRDPENEEWIVIGASDEGSFWTVNGEPCPPQWAFRLHRGAWYLQPVPKAFLGRLPNLLADLRVKEDINLSPAEFQAIVDQRKARQIPDSGFRISPDARSVGEVFNISKCKGKEPSFTRDFIVNDNMPAASLSMFPRM